MSKNSKYDVVVICPRFPPEYGGPGISFYRMAPLFLERKIKVLVIVMRTDKNVGRINIDGIDLLEIRTKKSKYGRLMFFIKVLWILFKIRKKYNSVHVFTSGWLMYFVPLLAKSLKKHSSFSMTLLDSDDPLAMKRSSYGKIKLKMFNFYNCLISINPEQKKRCIEILKRKEGIIDGSVGIDTKYFKIPNLKEKSEAKKYFGVPEMSYVVSFVGHLSLRKGIDLAVKIWLEVLKRLEEAYFIVKDSGTDDDNDEKVLRSILIEEINKQNRSKYFIFVKKIQGREIVRKVLFASDLYLFPSRKEGSPSSVMEAMSCGVPPVISPLEGFANFVVRDGVEGKVLNLEHNIQSIANEIISLLIDTDKRKKMGEQSNKRILELHSQDIALDAYLRAWNIK